MDLSTSAVGRLIIRRPPSLSILKQVFSNNIRIDYVLDDIESTSLIAYVFYSNEKEAEIIRNLVNSEKKLGKYIDVEKGYSNKVIPPFKDENPIKKNRLVISNIHKNCNWQQLRDWGNQIRKNSVQYACFGTINNKFVGIIEYKTEYDVKLALQSLPTLYFKYKLPNCSLVVEKLLNYHRVMIPNNISKKITDKNLINWGNAIGKVTCYGFDINSIGEEIAIVEFDKVVEAQKASIILSQYDNGTCNAFNDVTNNAGIGNRASRSSQRERPINKDRSRTRDRN